MKVITSLLLLICCLPVHGSYAESWQYNGQHYVVSVDEGRLAKTTACKKGANITPSLSLSSAASMSQSYLARRFPEADWSLQDINIHFYPWLAEGICAYQISHIDRLASGKGNVMRVVVSMKGELFQPQLR